MKTEPKLADKVADYKLSIAISQALIDAIDLEANRQYRTRASLIRQTLAEKFQPKAQVA